MSADAELRDLMSAIASGPTSAAFDLLSAMPWLGRAALGAGATRSAAAENFLTPIRHYLYAGDTALHVAAGAYRHDVARALIALGADVAVRNRHGAMPLHYAADGRPGTETWDPAAQAATIRCLIAAGANPNARDQSGVTPLHRAVRTRSAAAVEVLLDAGADPLCRNRNGSTAMMLATRQTGRSGSGSAEAKAQQAEILSLLESGATN